MVFWAISEATSTPPVRAAKLAPIAVLMPDWMGSVGGSGGWGVGWSSGVEVMVLLDICGSFFCLGYWVGQE